MDQLTEEQILAYIRHELSSDEMRAVEQILDRDSVLREQFNRLADICRWSEQLGLLREIDTVGAEDKLSKRIAVINQRVRWRQVASVVQRIAAVMFIPLLACTVYLFISRFSDDALHDPALLFQVESASGAVSMVQLPDSSFVWLNSGSSLKYPLHFADVRRVELVGQAYFKVNANRSHPFQVACKGVVVEAYGTSFDVSAYSNDPFVQVFLESGKVDFIAGATRLPLNPSNLLSYDTLSRQSRLTSSDRDQSSGWKDGRLVFRNTPFGEVIRLMERHYGVEITYDTPEFEKNQYTAVFTHERIDQALDLLKYTTPNMMWSSKEPAVQANASFSVREFHIREKVRKRP